MSQVDNKRKFRIVVVQTSRNTSRKLPARRGKDLSKNSLSERIPFKTASTFISVIDAIDCQIINITRL